MCVHFLSDALGLVHMESKKCPEPTNLSQNSGLWVKFDSNLWIRALFLLHVYEALIRESYLCRHVGLEVFLLKLNGLEILSTRLAQKIQQLTVSANKGPFILIPRVMILSQKLGKFIGQGDIYFSVRDICFRWRVIYLTGRDIYLTGRDIYFEKVHNFTTNDLGDEIFIMCTSP